MRNRATILFTAAVLISLIPAIAASQPPSLAPYAQDFELLVQTDPFALGNDGWIVYGNVFGPDGTSFLYGYGPFPAPNHNAAFSQIDLLQGGPNQGIQQLSVFSDYESGEHALGNIVESNVFQERLIEPANVGETWTFAFDAKLGNIELNTTAAAFIKTIDPNNGFSLTGLTTEDMTNIPAEWTGFTLSLTIDSGLAGQYVQFGFLNKATNYEGSGIFYDNVDVYLSNPSAVSETVAAFGATLRQNYPNPFNPSTRIEFALDRPGYVEVAVFDLAGRRIATLHQGELGIGEQVVMWNGRTDSGAPVASGKYSYVLKTPTGQVSRSMVLLK